MVRIFSEFCWCGSAMQCLACLQCPGGNLSAGREVGAGGVLCFPSQGDSDTPCPHTGGPNTNALPLKE